MILISVLICTHNPRRDFISRVLAALKEQTLPLEAWELIVIDNASQEALAAVLDLSWHPNGRVIREQELGLTPSRIRAAKESNGALLVFVDDDNVLAADYLKEALAVYEKYPFLGSFGGSVAAEYEISPDGPKAEFVWTLGIQLVTRAVWSNRGLDGFEMPFGVGLCVRRPVAEHWQAGLELDPRRRALDRRGKMLISCGDTDLALAAIDLDLATGKLPNLKVTHLMPKERLTEPYMLKLAAGLSFSSTILRWIRGCYQPPRYQPRVRRLFMWYEHLRSNPFKQHWTRAWEGGEKKAHAYISQWRDNQPIDFEL